MRGIYCLLISVKRDTRIRVGALGRLEFRNGTYCYVGSAQNGIETRVRRHLSQKKKLFWHIDYLLADKNARVADVFYKRNADRSEECKAARKFMQMAGGTLVKGFGCSDCNCASHLLFLSPGTSRSLRARSRMRGWRGLSGTRSPWLTRLSRLR